MVQNLRGCVEIRESLGMRAGVHARDCRDEITHRGGILWQKSVRRYHGKQRLALPLLVERNGSVGGVLEQKLHRRNVEQKCIARDQEQRPLKPFPSPMHHLMKPLCTFGVCYGFLSEQGNPFFTSRKHNNSLNSGSFKDLAKTVNTTKHGGFILSHPPAFSTSKNKRRDRHTRASVHVVELVQSGFKLLEQAPNTVQKCLSFPA
jgi:hypothetical protein